MVNSKKRLEEILNNAPKDGYSYDKEIANKILKEFVHKDNLPNKEDIESILSKWEKYCKKGQCCSSCIDDKELGYGDDIETCCCRHDNKCNIAETIRKLIEGEK